MGILVISILLEEPNQYLEKHEMIFVFFNSSTEISINVWKMKWAFCNFRFNSRNPYPPPTPPKLFGLYLPPQRPIA